MFNTIIKTLFFISVIIWTALVNYRLDKLEKRPPEITNIVERVPYYIHLTNIGITNGQSIAYIEVMVK